MRPFNCHGCQDRASRIVWPRKYTQIRYVVAVSRKIGVSCACENAQMKKKMLFFLGEQESKESGTNPYAVQIEECYGLDKIEFLQSHENLDIYQKAFDIIER